MEIVAQIAVWVLLISGILMIIGPIIIGLATKSFAGTIHSVEDGKLWFYRHGLSFLTGIFAIIAAAYVISVL